MSKINYHSKGTIALSSTTNEERKQRKTTVIRGITYKCGSNVQIEILWHFLRG